MPAMDSDKFLLQDKLNSLFQEFTKLCIHTEPKEQLDAFTTVVQPVRDVYYPPLLDAQERLLSLDAQLAQAQSTMQMIQSMNGFLSTHLEDVKRRWDADKAENREAAAMLGKNLRQEIKELREEIKELREKNKGLCEESKELHGENKELREESKGLRRENKEDSINLRRDMQREKEAVEQRLMEESTRWYNEYRNAREMVIYDDSGLKIKGSESHAQLWKKIKDESGQNPINQTLIVQKTWTYDDDAIARLVDGAYDSESDMYGGLIFLLSLLEKPMGPTCPGVKILDTHKRFYLRGLAPDITVSVDGVQDPDPASVYMVIEVKLREDATHDNENLGQLLDYLFEIRNAQPNRRHFAGMLTNLKSNVILVLESYDGERDCVTHYKPVNWQTALDFIQETVLTHPAHRPPSRGFSLDLGVMLRRLGKPTNSVVAEFYQQNGGQSNRARMVVKRSHAESSFVWSELRVLQMIHADAPQHISCILPELVYASVDEREFGITPVGYPLLTDRLPSAHEVRQILCDVLDALVWLHKLSEPLIHRDVRCENVIIRHDKNRMRGVLIDFDQVAISGINASYRGGYLCCPRELIGNITALTRYVPQPKHDYEAFVLMANMLAFTGHRSRGVLWHQVTKESNASRRLLEFWKEIEGSSFWGQYLAAANEQEPELLKEMCELFVYI